MLDLVEAADTFERKFHWICLALNDRRTTPDRLLDALERRKKFRDRMEAQLLLGDTGAGVRSWLEMLYVRGVERSHNLPRAERQVNTRHGGSSIYLDNLYKEYRLCVELDGAATHSGAQQLRDKRRDRRNAVRDKLLTLRFGYPDLRTSRGQCESAAEVASVMRDRGPYVGTSCGRPGCLV